MNKYLTGFVSSGLKELTVSANKNITYFGWSNLFVAMAASTSIHTCHLDYNNIGSQGAACLAVALVSNSSLRIVDLESCLISEEGAKVTLVTYLILFLVYTYLL